MSNNEVDEKNLLRQQLLCSFADDFKRYYFEAWRRELNMQRCPSQITLLLSQVCELQNETKKLSLEIKELKEINLKQRQSLQYVYNATNNLTDNLCDLANLVADIEKNKKLENK